MGFNLIDGLTPREWFSLSQEERNKVLYAQDCKLAQEWQQEWYNEVVEANIPWIRYD